MLMVQAVLCGLVSEYKPPASLETQRPQRKNITSPLRAQRLCGEIEYKKVHLLGGVLDSLQLAAGRFIRQTFTRLLSWNRPI